MTHKPHSPRRAPVTLGELSAALAESVLTGGPPPHVAGSRRQHRRSRAARLIGEAATALVDEESKLLAGIVLVVAMVVHLLLLAMAQPYAFPGYSTYWLPVTLLATSLLLMAFRRPFAAAWRNRMQRGR